MGALQSNAQGIKQVMPITIGVSVPVLVTGILLVVGGGVHKHRVRTAR